MSTTRKNIAIWDIKNVYSKSVEPFQLPPLRIRSSSRMAMGLKRLDDSNWLTIDSNYLPEHIERCKLFDNCRSQVIQCLPGTEEACHEVLELVTNFLASRFPKYFTLTSGSIHDHLTGQTLTVGPQCLNPLETTTRIAMEDFNILMKDPITNEYKLQASVTLFPAGWELQKRIGSSIANLHASVPGWEEMLSANVDRYFDHLTPKTSVERYNLFIQTTPMLFQNGPSFQQTPVLRLEDISVRRERQTFKRLEKSGAVLFTVRTFMQPLLNLSIEEVEGLRSQILGWEEGMARYKGVNVWGELVLGWCEGRLGGKEGGRVGEF